MRFRRKFRGKHTRRAGMKGDWLVLAHTLCPVVGPGIPQCTELPIPSSSDLIEAAFINADDLIAKEDALTIVRMVGEVHYGLSVIFGESVTSPLQIAVTFDEGIYLQTTDASGVGISLDPRLSTDAELDTWLWRRRNVAVFDTLGPGGAGGEKEQWWTPQDYASGMNAHLDLRVKRRMVRGQQLVYTAGCAQSVVFGVPTGLPVITSWMNFNMRGYVKF